MTNLPHWTEEERRALYQMLYLVICGIHQQKPDVNQVLQMDLKAVYIASKRHSLEALVWMALEPVIDQIPQDRELFQTWKEKREKASLKNALFDIERERLFEFLEKEGIWHMPLKGTVLKEWYPREGMRQMSDNDILFDAERFPEVNAWFEERGYKYVNENNVAAYMRPPVYNFEMHKDLYSALSHEAWYKHYKNVKERLIRVEGTNYQFAFTDEEFYGYLLSHAYKHFERSGTGVRSLVDVYVFLQKKENKLRENVLQKELKQLDLIKFEEEMRSLAEKVFNEADVFSPENLTHQERWMLEYLMGSGVYGNIENYAENGLRKQSTSVTTSAKFRYCIRRLVPDRDYYREFPVIDRHPYLIPGFVVCRLFRMLLHDRKRVWREVKTILNLENE